MRELTKYAFANAKIRAMRSRLIDADLFSRLLDSADIYELKDELKKTVYRPVFEKVSQDPLDVPAVEKELRRFDIDIYRKIYHMLNSKVEKEFVQLLTQRYELEQLKVALRIWHKKIPVKIEDYLLGEKIVFDIDFKKIVLCQNIEEIILLLDETPYKKALLKGRDKFKARNSLFYLEAALDINYYERLFAHIENLLPADRAIARKILGIEIDVENINWLIRLRKYYDVGMGEILDWVIPGGDKINKERVRSLYVSDGLSHVVESVAFGPYAELKTLMEQNAQMIEGFLFAILDHEVKRVLAGFPFTIGTILGYLILKHRETKNIISLLYAKSYGMKKEDTASLFSLAA